MKVVLLKPVKSLGKEGDVIEVSEGYARNFLFPQHMAVEGSKAQIEKVTAKREAEVRREKKSIEKEKLIAKEIEGREVTVRAKANEEGALYAAVGPKDIAKALSADGVQVEVDWIEFAPQKEQGEYTAVVAFPGGYEAELIVIIEAEI